MATRARSELEDCSTTASPPDLFFGGESAVESEGSTGPLDSVDPTGVATGGEALRFVALALEFEFEVKLAPTPTVAEAVLSASSTF